MLWRFIVFIIIIKNVEQSNKNYCKYSECQFAWALKNLDSIACQYLPIPIYLRRWIPIPGILWSKPQGGSKVDSASGT